MKPINEAFTPEESSKIYDNFLAIVNDSKRRNKLVAKHGKNAEAVAYGTAVNQIKKQSTKEPMDKEQKLKEMIQTALSKPLEEKKKSFPDLTGDGKITQADILKARGVELDEDLDLGHTDNEPHMLKGDLYRIGKYAMELYKMVDQFEGEQEVDFPHWWQAKIIKAKEMLVSAKHYLDFETKEPEIDAMVDVASEEGALGENLEDIDYRNRNNMMRGVYDLAKKSKDVESFKDKWYETYSRGPQDKDADTDEWLEKTYTRVMSRVTTEEMTPEKSEKIGIPFKGIDEKLKPSMGAGAYVDDFRTSDAPQFKGKSKKKKNKMAVAAYLSAKDKIKEAILAKLQESKGEYAKIEKQIADLKSKGKNAGDKEMQKLIKRRAELEKSKK
jgi:hypothetical protein